MFFFLNMYLCAIFLLSIQFYIYLAPYFSLLSLQSPIYVSFVSKAILWDRGLYHYTVSAQITIFIFFSFFVQVFQAGFSKP